MTTYKYLGASVALSALLMALSAEASIDLVFSTGGVAQQTVASDKVTIRGVTSQPLHFTGTDGEIVTATINYADWIVSSTRPTVTTFKDLTFDRSLTMSVGTQTLPQLGALQVLKKFGINGDTLFFAPGDEITFDFGTYKINVAANDFNSNGFTPGNAGTHNDLPVSANFQYVAVSPVPETTTLAAGVGALGLLILGASVHSKRTVLRTGK